MVRKKSYGGYKKNKVDNSQLIGIAIVIVFAVIALIFLLYPKGGNNENEGNLPPNPPQVTDCETVCKEAGYSGAVYNGCINLVKCNDPNYPLVEKQEVCGNELDVCCCKIGL